MRSRMLQILCFCVVALAALVVRRLFLIAENSYTIMKAEDLWEMECQENAYQRDIIHRQVDFVVGFYVGPTYAASVALFRNGTTQNLAQVHGDAGYRTAMQRRISRADVFAASGDDDGDSFGAATTYERDSVFLPTLTALKERSEAALQHPIRHVHFATPWIIAAPNCVPDDLSWLHPGDDTLVEVRDMLGLAAPFVYGPDALSMPLHLSEANAVLAVAGRQLCEECFCVASANVYNGGNSYLLYINLSDTSLFMSIGLGACVYEAFSTHLALDTEYGREQLSIQDTNKYWENVQERALSFFMPHLQESKRTATILIGGEATTDARFLSTVQSIQKKLVDLRAASANASREESNHLHGGGDGTNAVELIVARNGTFDAAKGAALLMHMDYWGFCDDKEGYEAHDVCQDHYERNGVEWPPYEQTLLQPYNRRRAAGTY